MKTISSKRHKRTSAISSVLILACTLLVTCGCSRSFWRTQADFDGYNLLSQKQFDPRWVIPRTSVEPDTRSRFYDVDDRDKPPLPPDDPAAARYMEWVNGMRGYKSWHKFGQNITVENPQWLANFGLAPDTFHDSYYMSDGITNEPDPEKLPTGGVVRIVPTIENLTLAKTIELAAIHSRDYQTQMENLFLSSLQLSLDQYQFQVRYLVGSGPNSPSLSLPGTSVPTGVLNDTVVPGVQNKLGLTTAGGVSQILPTGGQWIAGVANNTLWLFSSGGQQTTSQSLLSYSLVQPLLAGAGRKFFLENLTFSERNVLYNIRIMTRFRRLFFADAVVNNIGGNVSQPAAITASSGSSVANPVAISTNAGSIIAAGTTVGSQAASASGAPTGYYGLLYLLQQLLNQHEQVESYRLQVERMREMLAQTPFRRLEPGALPNGIVFPENLASKISYTPATRRLRWNVRELMSDAEREQLLALSNDAQYRNAIQEIFVQLRVGVTTLDYSQIATALTSAEIQERRLKLGYDEEIDQFKFFLGVPTDMQITVDRGMLKRFELTDPRLTSIEKRLLKFVRGVGQLDSDDPPIDELAFVVNKFAQLTSLVGTDAVDLVGIDLGQVKAAMPRRMKQLLWEDSRETISTRFERDVLIFENVRESFGEIARQVENWTRQVEDPNLPLNDRKVILSALKDAREDLMIIIQNCRVLQSGNRAELIELVDFDMSIEEATDTALENRLDLMNLRGRVMDARRNMEVAANRLEAILNLVSQGSLNTPSGVNHPLDFRGQSSSFQIGVQMTAPLDQLQVRNAYRSSLINYQQARRAYMLLEDQVKYDIRTSWRQLKTNYQNFEATRKNLREAAVQLDINVANSLNPRNTQEGAGGGGNLNAGLNLINATNAILGAQNNLIQTWTLYERNRINIYRDMDIMVIDERGLWTDPVYQNLDQSDSTINPIEPAHDIPPQPISSADGPTNSSRRKPSSHAGIARVRSFAPTVSAKTKVAEDRSADRRPAGRPDRLAPTEIRMVSGGDDAGEAAGRDGGPGDGGSEEGSVPDLGDRKGNSRQYEKRGSAE